MLLSSLWERYWVKWDTFPTYFAFNTKIKGIRGYSLPGVRRWVCSTDTFLLCKIQHPDSAAVSLSIGWSLHLKLECDQFESCCKTILSWGGSADNFFLHSAFIHGAELVLKRASFWRASATLLRFLQPPTAGWIALNRIFFFF